ncbi:hypothetical protein [Sorangium sp. So ce1099]|uniref:hypothetical protein n=1 Tax=Sorangium sp. So ce1099 TaxID=3133331 RepID=UPI003F63F6A8
MDRVTFEIGPGGPGGIADVEDEAHDKANRGSDGFERLAAGVDASARPGGTACLGVSASR